MLVFADELLVVVIGLVLFVTLAMVDEHVASRPIDTDAAGVSVEPVGGLRERATNALAELLYRSALRTQRLASATHRSPANNALQIDGLPAT